mgnify:CR=1 FL=1
MKRVANGEPQPPIISFLSAFFLIPLAFPVPWFKIPLEF